MAHGSDPRRRFFSPETPQTHGLTPAMVKAWDDAARAEKRAAGASDGATSGVTSSSSPAPASTAPSASKSGPLRQPWPGDYKQNFLDASASAAQRSSADKFEAGARTSMPVTR